MDFGSLWWFLFTWSFGTVSASQWYVSRTGGTNAVNCGIQQSHPCKSIYQAAGRAHDNDVINIDGSGTSRDPYPCESEPGLHIAGVLIRSYGTQAFIACKNSTLRFSCNTRNISSSGVSLARITFLNTSLYLIDCSLQMTEVNFVNGSTNALSLNFSRGLIGKIDFSGCTFYNNSGSALKIRGDSVNLNIKSSSLINNNLRVRKIASALFVISPQSLRAQFRVNFTNITVSRNTCPGKACLEIGCGSDGLLTMKIKEGIFEDNYASESVVDVSGTSVMEFTEIQFRKNTGRAVNIRDGNSVELKIMNGNFVNNEIEDFNKMANGGAVCVSGFSQNALVFMSRSNFTSNQGYNGGACAYINLKSVTLNIESCQFVENEGWSSGGALAVGTNYNWQANGIINIRFSNFSGNTLYFRLLNRRSSSYDTRDKGGGGALAFYVLNMKNLTLTNNTFTDNKAEQKNAGAIRANIGTLYQEAQFLNCNFVRNSGAIKSGTFQLSVSYPLSLSPPRVAVKGCTFIKNKANDLGTYDIFLYQNNLTISYCKVQNNSGGGIFLGGIDDTFDVRVENSLISDNDNFMFFLLRNQIDSNTSFKFTNVSMLRNNCGGRSSTFHVSMHHSRNSLHFQESKFKDNFCKSGVVKISVTPYPVLGTGVGSLGTAVIINNTEFQGNSGVAESTLTVLDAEVIQIENSSFINNFGSTDGSHVRVQLRSSELQIIKTIFYQSEKSQVFNIHREQPYNGFLTVTSFGNMSVRECSFISDPLSYDGKALIFVKGAGRVTMPDDSVTIQSPFGSKLNLHNFTHWESFNIGKAFKQTLITSFSMSTQPCPMGTYSIRRGTSKGFTTEHQVKCLPCPNGGNCTSALAARPNYWGYPIGDEVYFKFCPRGYCCPVVNQKCPYHNASYRHSDCQGNRTGILCGGCKMNFTETLFKTDCVPVEECTNRWYLVVILICISLFALYLIQKPPIFQKIASNLTWFITSNRKTDYHEFEGLDDENNTDGTSSFFSHGFLKILFYFYQVAGLLTISPYGVGELIRDSVVLPVISLLDFKLYPHSHWNICPFPGLTPLTKTLFQVVIVVAIFLSIPLIYLLHTGLNKLRKRAQALPPCGSYLGAILETVLLGYSAATGTAVRLLDCVSIQHVSRWYYNAEITCFQWWQSASIACIILYLFPFIFILYIGSLRLHQRQISAKMFLLACVFPLPYLFHAFVISLKKALARPHISQEMTSKTSSVEDNNKSSPCTLEASVLEVLSGPFCNEKQDDRSPGKIYWESIMIGRRFILILIGSFVPNAFLSSVCLAVLCLIFLLHHISQKPFVKFRANLAETVSLATLVVIAILNVGVAAYYFPGSEVGGVEQQYVRGLLLTEVVLLGFIPFVFVTFVVLSLLSQLVRLTIFLIQVARWLVTRSKTSKQEQDEPLLSPE